MRVAFRNSLPVITEAVVAHVESEFTIAFPQQYRQFLLQTNGGEPHPRVFTFMENGKFTDAEVQIIRGIFPVPYIPGGSLSRPEYIGRDFRATYRRYKFPPPRMPDELCPVASDSFGNQICMAMSGDKMGTVYFWDHEGEIDPEDEEGTPDWWRNVHFVANSFNEFLDSLHD